MTSLLTRCLGCLVRGMCWFPVVFVVCFMLWCYYVSVFVVMIFQGPGWASHSVPRLLAACNAYDMFSFVHRTARQAHCCKRYEIIGRP